MNQATAPQPDRPSAASAGVAIVGNPISGSPRGHRVRVARLAEALAQRGVEADVVWQPDDRRQRLGAPDASGRYRCVVAAGGDGTLADVVHDLAPHPDLPVAVLPMGNENLFAKHFGFDTTPEALADAIVAGQTHRLDVGWAGDRCFNVMLTAGLDAEVVHRVARWRRNEQAHPVRHVGHSDYLPRLLGSIRDYPYPPVTLEADGRRVTGAHAMVFNTPRYACGLALAPQADGADGQLDWIVFEEPGLLTAIGYAWLVWRHKHFDRRTIHRGRAREVRLTSQTGDAVPLQADGDDAGFTPRHVTVAPRALSVITLPSRAATA